MKKIITFVLWGDHPRYLVGAVRNAEIATAVYPEWVCRYYVTPDVPGAFVLKLRRMPNTEVFLVADLNNWRNLFYRMLPAFDATVDVMMSRDADSRLGPRCRASVDEWLLSDFDFHIMRDNAVHNTAIMGGMWGARNGILQTFSKLWVSMVNGPYPNTGQIDQQVYAELIYPNVCDVAFVHDDRETGEPNRVPWSTERTTLNHVGCAFEASDELRTE